MSFFIKVVCLGTLGFLIKDLPDLQVLSISAVTTVLSLMYYAEGYVEGYTKAGEDMVKVKSDEFN